MKAKNLTEAIINYQTALQLNPDLPPNFYKKLGDAYKQAGEIEEAISTYQSAIELNPKNLNLKTDLKLQLGRAQWLYQNYDLALNHFSEAKELSPQRIDVKIATANILIELKRFAEAETALQEVLSLSENHLVAWLKLAEIQRKQGDQVAALESFEIAGQNHPEDLRPHLSQVEVLIALNRINEAESKLNFLLEKYPDDGRVLIRQGILERQRNAREKALSWFRLAEKNPFNPQQKLAAQKHIVEELQVLGSREEALTLIQEIIQDNPDDMNARMMLANFQRQKFDFTAAVETYQ